MNRHIATEIILFTAFSFTNSNDKGFTHPAGADILDNPVMADRGVFQKRNMDMSLAIVAMFFHHEISLREPTDVNNL